MDRDFREAIAKRVRELNNEVVFLREKSETLIFAKEVFTKIKKSLRSGGRRKGYPHGPSLMSFCVCCCVNDVSKITSSGLGKKMLNMFQLSFVPPFSILSILFLFTVVLLPCVLTA